MLHDRDGNPLSPEYACIQRLINAIGNPEDRKEPRHVINALKDKCTTAQIALRDAFADQFAWDLAKSWFSLHELRNGHNRTRWTDALWPVRWPRNPIDHAEYYCFAWGSHFPAAIVSHEYGPFEDSETFAKANGLIATRLPASWYYPARATAVVYTSPLIPFPPRRP